MVGIFYFKKTYQKVLTKVYTFYFGELNDDEVHPGELLFSGSIAVWDEETEDWKAVDFKIEESELNENDYLDIEDNGDAWDKREANSKALEAVVKVTRIY